MELFHIFLQKFLGNPKESPNFAPAFGKRRASSTSLSLSFLAERFNEDCAMV